MSSWETERNRLRWEQHRVRKGDGEKKNKVETQEKKKQIVGKEIERENEQLERVLEV